MWFIHEMHWWKLKSWNFQHSKIIFCSTYMLYLTFSPHYFIPVNPHDLRGRLPSLPRLPQANVLPLVRRKSPACTNFSHVNSCFETLSKIPYKSLFIPLEQLINRYFLEIVVKKLSNCSWFFIKKHDDRIWL